MDRAKLSRIDQELDSSEVASLCFLCSDVVPRGVMEDVKDAKGLFQRLEDKGLMENNTFLFQLLCTIRRLDLLDLLQTDSRQPEEADAAPLLSEYRVMLYQIFQDMSTAHFEGIKYLMEDHLERGKLERCKTALDLFAEMEKATLLSNRKLDLLHTILLKFDKTLASTVQRYTQGLTEPAVPPHVSMDTSRSIPAEPTQPAASMPDSQTTSESDIIVTYAESNPESSSIPDTSDYYPMNHIPRGLCVVFNNENFQGGLGSRRGTKEDEQVLQNVFRRLGFTVVVHNDLTSYGMIEEVDKLSKRNFIDDDALVVCVLSHGEEGSVYGSDSREVWIKELTFPFRCGRAPTLAEKPKLFFIQACQGKDYQSGSVRVPSRPSQAGQVQQSRIEDDAGPVQRETVPNDADFLLGMATVPTYKSFRHTTTGSIYIQELCRQLMKSAESSEMDDILTVLTRVNREVSKGDFKINNQSHKQMPEPKYTLTRKVVLKYV